MKIAILVVLSFFLVVVGLVPSASAGRFDFDKLDKYVSDYDNGKKVKESDAKNGQGKYGGLAALKLDWKELKADLKELKSEWKELKSEWKNGNYANSYVQNGTTYVPNGNSVPGPETFSVFLVGFGLFALWRIRQRSLGRMPV